MPIQTRGGSIISSGTAPIKNGNCCCDDCPPDGGLNCMNCCDFCECDMSESYDFTTGPLASPIIGEVLYACTGRTVTLTVAGVEDPTGPIGTTGGCGDGNPTEGPGVSYDITQSCTNFNGTFTAPLLFGCTDSDELYWAVFPEFEVGFDCISAYANDGDQLCQLIYFVQFACHDGSLRIRLGTAVTVLDGTFNNNTIFAEIDPASTACLTDQGTLSGTFSTTSGWCNVSSGTWSVTVS